MSTDPNYSIAATMATAAVVEVNFHDAILIAYSCHHYFCFLFLVFCIQLNLRNACTFARGLHELAIASKGRYNNLPIILSHKCEACKSLGIILQLLILWRSSVFSLHDVSFCCCLFQAGVSNHGFLNLPIADLLVHFFLWRNFFHIRKWVEFLRFIAFVQWGY